MPGHGDCHEKVASAVSVRAAAPPTSSVVLDASAFSICAVLYSQKLAHFDVLRASNLAMSVPALRLSASNASRIVRLAPTWTRYRSIHARRELPYPVEGGLGDFLPPAALKTVAVDWQEGLLQRLNEEVKGESSLLYGISYLCLTKVRRHGTEEQEGRTNGDRHRNRPHANRNVQPCQPRTKQQLLPRLPRKPLLPAWSPLLKPCSFQKPLAPGQTDHEADMSPELMVHIRNNFGDLGQLKSDVGAVSRGMVGSGFVWVVSDPAGQLAVLPTYAAGTLLVQSRTQRNPHDGSRELVLGEVIDGGPARPSAAGGASAPTSPASGLVPPTPATGPPPFSRAFSTARPARADDTGFGSGAASIYGASDPTALAFSTHSPINKGKNLRGMGEAIFPLFCISIHEHCWLSAGFGVWGKDEWLRQFWTVLDWGKVSKAFGKRGAMS